MIAVCDINEVWRRKPFEALAGLDAVLGLSPADFLAARHRTVPEAVGGLDILTLVLPLGWASKTAWLGQRMLLRKIAAEARRRGGRIECVVATSPHYTTLLELLPQRVVKIYYASDDYQGYEGWGNMAEKERHIVGLADHSVFVSEALAHRAREDYGVDASRISVSMNATEHRFFRGPDEHLPMVPPCGDLPRPIAGVVGGINDRLDFGLLRSCADLPGLGTLLLVGPLPDTPSPELAELLAHPKCVAPGAQPHGRIHEWFKCLDLGLVPYVYSTFNKFCSPMRLFDHLATGLPLVCTDACDQVAGFSDALHACSTPGAFLEALAACLKGEGGGLPSAADVGWDNRAAGLHDLISNLSATKAARI